MVNLDNYEDVNSRIARFRQAHPEGRLVVTILDRDPTLANAWVLIEAQVFKKQDDLHPAGVDVAFGHVAFYRENMKRWFVEDTSTSAIGRAISLVLPSQHRPTRQDMEHAQADPWKLTTEEPTPAQAFKDEAVAIARAALNAKVVEMRCVHGERNHKKGVNKKGGTWEGYFCPSTDEHDKCPTIGADGKEWVRR